MSQFLGLLRYANYLNKLNCCEKKMVTNIRSTSFYHLPEFYRKIPKNLDTQTKCCNHSKMETMCFYHRFMHPDADRMANSVDPDQTRSSLIWSILFAQNCLKI